MAPLPGEAPTHSAALSSGGGEEAFIVNESRFRKKYVVDESTGCWIWSGAKHRGYGQMLVKRRGKQKNLRAHRVSWELHNGLIDDGLSVCHKCDVPSCVNPDHLFLGTHAENMADMALKGRNLTGGARECQSKAKKLTVEAVDFILASNMTGVELARMFDVSQPMISMIRRGKSWQ